MLKTRQGLKRWCWTSAATTSGYRSDAENPTGIETMPAGTSRHVAARYRSDAENPTGIETIPRRSMPAKRAWYRSDAENPTGIETSIFAMSYTFIFYIAAMLKTRQGLKLRAEESRKRAARIAAMLKTRQGLKLLDLSQRSKLALLSQRC